MVHSKSLSIHHLWIITWIYCPRVMPMMSSMLKNFYLLMSMTDTCSWPVMVWFPMTILLLMTSVTIMMKVWSLEVNHSAIQLKRWPTIQGQVVCIFEGTQFLANTRELASAPKMIQGYWWSWSHDIWSQHDTVLKWMVDGAPSGSPLKSGNVTEILISINSH